MRIPAAMAMTALVLAACGGGNGASAADPGGLLDVVLPGPDAADADTAAPADPGPGDAAGDPTPADGTADAPLPLEPLDVPGGYTAVCGTVPALPPQGNLADARCAGCVDAHCCDAATICRNDLWCLVLRQCLAICLAEPAEGCEAACRARYDPGTSQSDEVSSCVASSCPAECADWSCLGQPWPPPGPASYTFQVRLVPVGTAQPKGGTVKVCALGDEACAPPLSQATLANGIATVTAPSILGGIAAYLEVAADGFLPGLAFLQQPDPAAFQGAEPLRVVVAKSEYWASLAGMAQVESAPDRGHVVFLARGCGDAGAAGIRVTATTADDRTVRAYLRDGQLDVGDATAPDGVGILFNLPAGPTTLRGTFADDRVLGSVEALVRAGTITSVTLPPTPEGSGGTP